MHREAYIECSGLDLLNPEHILQTPLVTTEQTKVQTSHLDTHLSFSATVHKLACPSVNNCRMRYILSKSLTSIDMIFLTEKRQKWNCSHLSTCRSLGGIDMFHSYTRSESMRWTNLPYSLSNLNNKRKHTWCSALLAVSKCFFWSVNWNPFAWFRACNNIVMSSLKFFFKVLMYKWVL